MVSLCVKDFGGIALTQVPLKSVLRAKKVLCLMAHPDDEVVFGWPILQDRGIERHLIVVSGDYERYGSKRIQGLASVCNEFGIVLQECLSLPATFYNLPTRYAGLTLNVAIQQIEAVLRRVIQEVEPDYLFTHNPMGEEGHGSHRFLFELVIAHELFSNVLVSDMVYVNRNRLTVSHISKFWQKMLYNTKNYIGETELDEEFFVKCRDFYENCGTWTWRSGVPTGVAKMYSLSI